MPPNDLELSPFDLRISHQLHVIINVT